MQSDEFPGYSLFLANAIQIAQILSKPKTMRLARMDCMKPGNVDTLTGSDPRKKVSEAVITDMLSNWPAVRTAPVSPDASPIFSFPALSSNIAVFDNEKMLMPEPSRPCVIKIRTIEAVGVKKAATSRPMPLKAAPSAQTQPFGQLLHNRVATGVAHSCING